MLGKELVKLFIVGLYTNHTDSMAESNFILFGFLKIIIKFQRACMMLNVKIYDTLEKIYRSKSQTVCINAPSLFIV